MIVIAVCSTKHSPGATTLALALVTAWATAPTSLAAPFLVEADPAGGDLAARLGVGFDPGLVSLAASARHAGSELDLANHAQQLPCGAAAVLAPLNPEQAATAIATVAPRLDVGIRAGGGGVADCGRWSAGSPATEVMRGADLTLVVLRPDVAGIEHFEQRLEGLSAAAHGRVGVVLAGDRPYDVEAVRSITYLRLVLEMPVDAHGAGAITGESTPRAARRSRLVRAARSILDTIEASRVEGVLA